MYPEFIAIYVMLVIVIGLLAVNLVFLLKLLKGGAPSAPASAYQAPQANANAYQQPYQQAYQTNGGNVVFCRHCATQFDASQGYCPNCGTPR